MEKVRTFGNYTPKYPYPTLTVEDVEGWKKGEMHVIKAHFSMDAEWKIPVLTAEVQYRGEQIKVERIMGHSPFCRRGQHQSVDPSLLEDHLWEAAERSIRIL